MSHKENPDEYYNDIVGYLPESGLSILLCISTT